MIGKYNKSVILTYIGACLAMFGMMLAFRGEISYAVICLIFAGISDLFDGVIARKCTRDTEAKNFGIQIDSLTDMLSFIALPCVIGFSLTTNIGYYVLPVFVLYALGGIIRLAWFNIRTNSDISIKYYEGLPVTYSALIIPIFYVFRGLLNELYYSYITLAVYMIVAILFIWRVKIAKPRGVWYIIFAVMSIAVTLLILAVGE